MVLRRILISAVSLAIALVAADWYLGRRNQGTGPGESNGVVRPTFTPTQEQLERWSKKLDRLHKVEEGSVAPKADALMEFSPRYGWTLATNVQTTFMGTRVSVNNIGARRVEDTPPNPPSGTLRVGCYGESFTFCFEVHDGEDWPSQLEQAATGKLEVLNMGVIGWGTDQSLLRFRDTQQALQSDIVLLGIMSENIQRNVNRLVSVRAPEERQPLVKPRFILNDGDLTLLPHPYTSKIELYEAAVHGRLGTDLAEHEWLSATPPGAGWSNMADTVREKRYRSERRRWWLQWNQPEGEPFQVTLALIEAFHKEALASGAKMAGIVIFPSITDLGDPSRKLTALHAALGQRQIPYVDTYDVIDEQHKRGLPAYGESHLTASANRSVAEAVHQWLDSELGL